MKDGLDKLNPKIEENKKKIQDLALKMVDAASNA